MYVELAGVGVIIKPPACELEQGVGGQRKVLSPAYLSSSREMTGRKDKVTPPTRHGANER